MEDSPGENGYQNGLKRSLDQDPDYIDAAPPDLKRLKTLEQAARADTSTRVKKIINDQFDKEFENYKAVANEVDTRIARIKQELHFLRYAAATAYYSNKNLNAEVDQMQHPIHPAIRQHLGKRPRTNQPHESQIAETSSISNKPTDETLSKVPRYIPPKLNIPEIVATPMRADHYRVKKKLIIGNVSKWIPISDRKDTASHKWMVYVRGSRESPSVDHFVARVQFFLHPSYAPHDIVEVKAPPFHVTRRGWGEFPLRVQIHFKNPLDKAVNIIHHLKLDRSYTGLQTLGAETVVDVLVYDQSSNEEFINTNSELPYQMKSEVHDEQPTCEVPREELNITVKEEPLSHNEQTSLSPLGNHIFQAADIKQEPVEAPTGNDTFQAADVKQEPVEVILENETGAAGSSESTKSNTDSAVADSASQKSKQQQPMMVLCRTNKGTWVKVPITSLKKAVTIKTVNGASAQPVTSLPSSIKPISLTKITLSGLPKISLVPAIPHKKTVIPVTGSKAPASECLLSPTILKIAEEKKKHESFINEIVTREWPSVRDCVRILARSLKIIDPGSLDWAFRCIRPYCAPSDEIFNSWNIGKQRSAEWQRAKSINAVLQRCKFPGGQTPWTTKKIFTWSRRQGYSPLAAVSDEPVEERRNTPEVNSLTEAQIPELPPMSSGDVNIDIESAEPSTTSTSSRIPQDTSAVDLLELESAELTDWVANTVNKLGFRLGPDEVDGGHFNISRVVLTQIWKSFAEDLLRRSLKEAWQSGKQPAAIELEDTASAVLRRPEFTILTNDGLGKTVEQESQSLS